MKYVKIKEIRHIASSLTCNLSLLAHQCVSITQDMQLPIEIIEWIVTVIKIYNAPNSRMNKFIATVITGVTVG